LSTIATGSTGIGINKTRGFSQRYTEVSLFAINGFNNGTCVKFDIDMPADLDQFW
jgi:hypothetical protein